MSRWLPWLAELQPELFIEIGRDLASEKGIRNLDWVHVTSPRGRIRAKALVTDRIGVMNVGGKRIHHVGMPWHWGWMGLDRKSTRLNSSHSQISYAVFCLKKKKKQSVVVRQ